MLYFLHVFRSIMLIFALSIKALGAVYAHRIHLQKGSKEESGSS